MRDAFIHRLTEAAEKDKRIYLLTGDLGFSVFEEFRKAFPGRFINSGIAEQNMMSVASGLSKAGKIPVVYSIIPFTVLRCLEQIKIDICYQRADVKIVGIGAGCAYGALGITHHATEDIASLRCMPNMTILSPCDPFETQGCLDLALNTKGPFYLRLGKNKEAKVYVRHPRLRIGGLNTLKKGGDAVIFTTGSVASRALEARNILESKGIKAEVVSVYSVKPIDKQGILRRAKLTGRVVTVEEHNIIGGLGSAVAEILAEEAKRIKFKRIAIKDKFCDIVGDHNYILDKCGFSADNIARIVLTI